MHKLQIKFYILCIGLLTRILNRLCVQFGMFSSDESLLNRANKLITLLNEEDAKE